MCFLDRCRCGGGRDGDDHSRAALPDCTMPCSASSRARQNRHGRVSLRWRLQKENQLATRCRGSSSTTSMKKVLAKTKLHLYKIFKILYWLKWYLGFWGFKKSWIGWGWVP